MLLHNYPIMTTLLVTLLNPNRYIHLSSSFSIRTLSTTITNNPKVTKSTKSFQYPTTTTTTTILQNTRLFSSTETEKETTTIPKWIRIKDVEKSASDENPKIEIKGWVRTVRKQKTLAFVEVNDGSSLKGIQCVLLNDDVSDETKSNISKLTTGTSVTVQGSIKKSQGGKQAYEISASSLDIIGGCPGETYPLAKKRHTLEYLRSIAHLRSRTNTHAAISRVRSTLAQRIHEFFQEEGFIFVQTPIITASVSCFMVYLMYHMTFNLYF